MVMILSTETVQRAPIAHLEDLFNRYPDLNAEVILKEACQQAGFYITKAAVDIGKGEILKTYHLFSWDPGRLDDMEDSQAPVKLPNTITVHGGPYGLRPTIMRPRINPASPFLIDAVDGVPYIMDRETRQVIAEIKPWPRVPLEYFSRAFPDGTAYAHVVGERGDAIVFRQCLYWGPEHECKFCDINENARTKRLLGQVSTIQPKNPDQVGDAAFALVKLEDSDKLPAEALPLWQYKNSIHLNGGTIIDKMKRQTEQEFYLSFVAAIRERVGNDASIVLQSVPWTRDLEQHAKDVGVTSRTSNFEVWDPGLFNVISPGKAGHIGRDEWIRRMLDQVDVFGVGNVTPGFVAGVEMAQPWGFKTVRDAVRSTTEGMEFFMSHGIVVRPISWCVEALSALGGQTAVPVDYFLQIDRAWSELYQKYDLPPQSHQPIGPGRNYYPNSAAWDVDF